MSKNNDNELGGMCAYFEEKTVIFLEMDDFAEDGSFKHSLYQKHMLIMVGGSFCGHCRHCAPDFNIFAKNNKNIVSGVVQVDGSADEKKLGKHLGSLMGIKGIPTFLLYGPDGKLKKIHEGERTADAFQEFVNQNL